MYQDIPFDERHFPPTQLWQAEDDPDISKLIDAACEALMGSRSVHSDQFQNALGVLTNLAYNEKFRDGILSFRLGVPSSSPSGGGDSSTGCANVMQFLCRQLCSGQTDIPQSHPPPGVEDLLQPQPADPQLPAQTVEAMLRLVYRLTVQLPSAHASSYLDSQFVGWVSREVIALDDARSSGRALCLPMGILSNCLAAPLTIRQHVKTGGSFKALVNVSVQKVTAMEDNAEMVFGLSILLSLIVDDRMGSKVFTQDNLAECLRLVARIGKEASDCEAGGEREKARGASVSLSGEGALSRALMGSGWSPGGNPVLFRGACLLMERISDMHTLLGKLETHGEASGLVGDLLELLVLCSNREHSHLMAPLLSFFRLMTRRSPRLRVLFCDLFRSFDSLSLDQQREQLLANSAKSTNSSCGAAFNALLMAAASPHHRVASQAAALLESLFSDAAAAQTSFGDPPPSPEEQAHVLSLLAKQAGLGPFGLGAGDGEVASRPTNPALCLPTSRPTQSAPGSAAHLRATSAARSLLVLARAWGFSEAASTPPPPVDSSGGGLDSRLRQSRGKRGGEDGVSVGGMGMGGRVTEDAPILRVLSDLPLVAAARGTAQRSDALLFSLLVQLAALVDDLQRLRLAAESVVRGEREEGHSLPHPAVGGSALGNARLRQGLLALLHHSPVVNMIAETLTGGLALAAEPSELSGTSVSSSASVGWVDAFCLSQVLLALNVLLRKARQQAQASAPSGSASVSASLGGGRGIEEALNGASVLMTAAAGGGLNPLAASLQNIADPSETLSVADRAASLGLELSGLAEALLVSMRKRRRDWERLCSKLRVCEEQLDDKARVAQSQEAFLAKEAERRQAEMEETRAMCRREVEVARAEAEESLQQLRAVVSRRDVSIRKLETSLDESNRREASAETEASSLRQQMRGLETALEDAKAQVEEMHAQIQRADGRTAIQQQMREETAVALQKSETEGRQLRQENEKMARAVADQSAKLDVLYKKLIILAQHHQSATETIERLRSDLTTTEAEAAKADLLSRQLRETASELEREKETNRRITREAERYRDEAERGRRETAVARRQREETEEALRKANLQMREREEEIQEREEALRAKDAALTEQKRAIVMINQLTAGLNRQLGSQSAPLPPDSVLGLSAPPVSHGSLCALAPANRGKEEAESPPPEPLSLSRGSPPRPAAAHLEETLTHTASVPVGVAVTAPMERTPPSLARIRRSPSPANAGKVPVVAVLAGGTGTGTEERERERPLSAVTMNDDLQVVSAHAQGSGGPVSSFEKDREKEKALSRAVVKEKNGEGAERERGARVKVKSKSGATGGVGT
uniref:Uncharacterized protein n=2 Tax=Chromera velia CCMP2878 TaxID=1169474 RepID=A0A0K6S7H0_9ALVE|eukprot:Cvel_21754.t1-p1 / transcript=Cvel_21754.t1 / gene=Cvel_21754 / organism=Chromera_velia_CCMP2878 / gene_product=Serine/threonine-protein kinase MRCK beta, putative / transcript_product=Serine/threonine-protein kinase MRCK beta, putative / location=Cvel_scaffold2068:13618-18750(-) / protein_length=1332 / sequence_SO=supercontig / SO=protein_coding / is_pseudo=false